MEQVSRCMLPAQISEPYPPVRAEARSPQYARAMLSNVGGSTSEMSAVCRYFYDHLVTSGVPELAEALHHISIEEMHHLEIFGILALQLGADPRLWSVQQGRYIWWTPEHLSYPRRLGPMLHSAIQAEQATIRKYRNQIRWIRDGNVVENLRRIVLDEERHIEILTCMCDKYASSGL